MTPLCATVPAPSQAPCSQNHSANPLPFSAVPHQLRRDLKGNQTAISLAAALLEYARQESSCYPTTARLAEDMGCSQQTIRNALAALVAAGWVRVVLGSDQPNGRLIVLTWREQPRQVSDTPQPIGPPLKPAGGGLKSSGAKTRKEEENLKRHVSIALTESRTQPVAFPIPCPTLVPAISSNPPVPAPTAPPAPRPTAASNAAPVAQRSPQSAPPPLVRPGGPVGVDPAPVASQPATVRPILEELKSLPGADDARVRTTAWRLAHHFSDVASLAFWIKCVGLVAAGGAPVERLVDAFTAADRARGHARNPAAVLVARWLDWQPKLLPSQINVPQFHRVTSGGCSYTMTTPSSSTTVVPPGTADTTPDAAEIAQWQAWARSPRHPLRGIALAELARLGVVV